MISPVKSVILNKLVAYIVTKQNDSKYIIFNDNLLHPNGRDNLALRRNDIQPCNNDRTHSQAESTCIRALHIPCNRLDTLKQIHNA